MRVKASIACPISVCVVRRNLRRTGVLKNRWRTSRVVPTGQPQGRTSLGRPPITSSSAPASASAVRLRISSWLTSAMEASASPRKPSERTWNRSSASLILLVAWLATASGSWSAGCRSRYR